MSDLDEQAELASRAMYRSAAEYHKAEVLRLRMLHRYEDANEHADLAGLCFLEAGYKFDPIVERLRRYVGP